MKSFTFNTGRQYSEEGQQIDIKYDVDVEYIDWLDEDSYTYTVLFHDKTRMIVGRTMFQKSISLTQAAIATWMMEEYDNGTYDSITTQEYEGA